MASPTVTAAPILPFKQRYTLEERKRKFGLLREQQPDRVHLIIEPSVGARLDYLEKCYLLTAPNTLIAQVVSMIKTKIALDSPEQALFLYIGSASPPLSAAVGDLYMKHHDEDGFLYINYCGEATYG